MKVDRLKTAFVKEIPESLEPGILYLALDFDAMAHLCACGCGREVSTPISPTDWKITWNGVGMSVRPSIGNGSLACRSHYVIEGGRINWCAPMSDRDIKTEQARTAKAKGLVPTLPPVDGKTATEPQAVASFPEPVHVSWLVTLWHRLFKR
ncbi:DUF6527 family protein [Falsirhodobacter sp. alg1]|uniref:DUF6527 family protein n=1 Tax=Falsirhodobacter sp. alg1 TaxID=1472418 RepID=UPI00069396C6|nr:DUF6527 family protein [Falsirhodobacter sp. alg1]